MSNPQKNLDEMCFVCLQKPSTSPSITLHGIPVDEDMKLLWMEACGLSKEDYTTERRVCSQHFTDNCFITYKSKRYLYSNSVPSIFVTGNSNAVSNLNPAILNVMHIPNEQIGPIKSAMFPDHIYRINTPRNHTYPVIYFCFLCSRFILSENAVKLHLDKCPPPHILDYSENNRDETFENSVIQMHDNNHCSKKFVCNFCGKSFTTKQTIKRHLITHENIKSFKCEVCKKYFGQQWTLKLHMMSHTDEKSLQCHICGKQLFSKSNLKKHIITHSTKKLGCFHCNICNTSYFTKKNLIKHEKIHPKIKPFICEICSKCFLTKSDLSYYHDIQDKPFQCHVCKKWIFIKSYLASHILTRTGQRPIKVHGKKVPNKCVLCNQIFSNLTYKKNHMLYHIGESPYSCEICKVSFSQKRNIKVHMDLHTGEKPFQCDECEKSFTRKQNLKIHMIRVHNQK